MGRPLVALAHDGLAARDAAPLHGRLDLAHGLLAAELEERGEQAPEVVPPQAVLDRLGQRLEHRRVPARDRIEAVVGQAQHDQRRLGAHARGAPAA